MDAIVLTTSSLYKFKLSNNLEYVNYSYTKIPKEYYSSSVHSIEKHKIT